MSDTFDHYNDAMESYYNELNEGYLDCNEEYPLDYKLPEKKRKNISKLEFLPIPPGFHENKSKITVTHFGKNLISEMSQSHLENSIKFVISKNSVLDDYKKELIKNMTDRLNQLKNKNSSGSYIIIDKETGEIILEIERN